MRLAKLLGALGRAMISAGVLVLLFVAYQLWGTGVREAQAQNRLAEEFAALVEAGEEQDAPAPAPAPAPTPGPAGPEQDATPALPAGSAAPIPDGEPVGRIRIPSIGLDRIVVSGISLETLRKGPGHFPQTPLPGQEGNAAIAGHRTTYGAPFNRIDELAPGDEIFVETPQGEFRYVVADPPHQIVAPRQVEVLDYKGDDRLTLTACHPEFSARQRIVVTAMLAPEARPLPFVPPADLQHAQLRPPAAGAAFDDVPDDGGELWPAVLAGALFGALWALAWALGRWWRRWPTYLLATPVLLVALFFFFEALSRLMPAGY